MLKNIKLKNLGCFDEYDYNVNLNKITVIVGENNSGKSTIFKAVNLIRLLPTYGLAWDTPFYSLRDKQEATYGHDTSRIIEFSFEYEDNTENFIAKLTLHPNGAIEQILLVNGEPYTNLNDQIFKNIIEKIWYFMPNRLPIPYESSVMAKQNGIQPISPAGIDIASYLLGKWTDRDPNWDEAEKWLKKIDSQMTLLKTPVVNGKIRMSTQRSDGKTDTSINLSLQGTGMQNAATIISGIIFSPKNATIIIEEPENFLHPRTIETFVDLFNHAVNNLGKQIVITTHSWDILRAYISDVGVGSPRGSQHVKANPEDFKLIVFTKKLGIEKIIDYDMRSKKFEQVVNDFKTLWG